MMSFRPRDLKRAMRRMGLEVEELSAIKVRLELDDGTTLLVEEPQAVLLIKAKGQPPMIYVIGEPVRVEARSETGEAPEISEEDIALVAEQAGVSPEEARRALEETGGDIAAAILKLQGASGSGQ